MRRYLKKKNNWLLDFKEKKNISRLRFFLKFAQNLLIYNFVDYSKHLNLKLNNVFRLF